MYKTEWITIPKAVKYTSRMLYEFCFTVS